MSVTSGFFDSLNGDRKYNAKQFSSLIDTLVNDGVFANVGTAFVVNAAGGLVINVGIGRAWFNSAWVYNDAIYPIEVNPAEVLLNRIDAVVIEINHSEEVRAGRIRMVYGIPAQSPEYPELLDTDNVHQYPLAYITRTAGSTEITQADITNKVGTSDCPFITGILQTLDIDQLIAQWKAEFDAWFDGLKDIVEDDPVISISNKVIELEERFTTLAKENAVYDELEDSTYDAILDSTGNTILCRTKFMNSANGGANMAIISPVYPIPNPQEIGAADKVSESFSSYMTFCTNANTDALDSAFGKNNEENVSGIGMALAMYAWFKGDSKSTYPFYKLRECDTLEDCLQTAFDEILDNDNVYNIISASPYAKTKIFTDDNITSWKKSYDIMNLLITRPDYVDVLRNDHWDIFKNGWQTYTARGSGNFIVPSGVSCITYEVVGPGAIPPEYEEGDYADNNGMSGGQYYLGCMSVTTGQVIAYSISEANTTFGSVVLTDGGGAPGGPYYDDGRDDYNHGRTPSQSGKFLVVGAGGKSYSDSTTGIGGGGGGGYGGGNGGKGGTTSENESNHTPTTIGPAVLPITEGTGGAGGQGQPGNGTVGNGAAGTGGGGGGGGGNARAGGAGGAGYGGGGGGGCNYNSGARYDRPGKSGSGCVVIYM